MITIKDIADLAGVSPTTVSNVLHGRTGKMSRDTLQKVQTVIQEQNYISNMAGRLLANYGSKIIGVIMTYERRSDLNVVQNPFYSEIIGALEEEIRRNGYFMMLYTSGGIEESIQMALSWNVEGVILLGCPPSECKKIKNGLQKPLVFIDAYFPEEDESYYNVGLDDFYGGYLMAKYFIQMGHRNLTFFADSEGHDPVGVDAERLNGCRKAFAESRLPENHFISMSYKKELRHSQLRQFFREQAGNCTALFFASDFYAMDAINLLFEEGFSVPDDFSVAGFDDNIFALESRPKLSTIKQDVSAKAYHSVRKLMKLIHGETDDTRNLRLPVQLTVRESIRKLSL